jgi:hypothetical protein
MEKENYIETILNSTNGITKVAPNADLFSKIELRIQSTNTVSTKTLWLVAASIVVLLTINVSVIMKTKTKSERQVVTTLASTLNKSNQLY